MSVDAYIYIYIYIYRHTQVLAVYMRNGTGLTYQKSSMDDYFSSKHHGRWCVKGPLGGSDHPQSLSTPFFTLLPLDIFKFSCIIPITWQQITRHNMNWSPVTEETYSDLFTLPIINIIIRRPNAMQMKPWNSKQHKHTHQYLSYTRVNLLFLSLKQLFPTQDIPYIYPYFLLL